MRERMGAAALHGAECFRNEYSCPRLDSGNPAGRALLLRGTAGYAGSCVSETERWREKEREGKGICDCARPTAKLRRGANPAAELSHSQDRRALIRRLEAVQARPAAYGTMRAVRPPRPPSPPCSLTLTCSVSALHRRSVPSLFRRRDVLEPRDELPHVDACGWRRGGQRNA